MPVCGTFSARLVGCAISVGTGGRTLRPADPHERAGHIWPLATSFGTRSAHTAQASTAPRDVSTRAGRTVTLHSWSSPPADCTIEPVTTPEIVVAVLPTLLAGHDDDAQRPRRGRDLGGSATQCALSESCRPCFGAAALLAGCSQDKPSPDVPDAFTVVISNDAARVSHDESVDLEQLVKESASKVFELLPHLEATTRGNGHAKNDGGRRAAGEPRRRLGH